MAEPNDSGKADQLRRVAEGDQKPTPMDSGLDVRRDPDGTVGLGNPAMRARFGQGGDRTRFDDHGEEACNPVVDRRTGTVRFNGESIRTQPDAVNRANAAVLRCRSLDGCDLRELPFSGKSLKGGNLNDADCTGGAFERTDLNQAQLGGTIFDSARMAGANLYLAKAPKASFRGADLRHARFKGADLREADFEGAIVDGADFTGADLRGSNLLSKAKSMHGAHLGGALTESREYLDKKYPRP